MGNPAFNVRLNTEQAQQNPNGFAALASRAAELEREERYITAQEVWLMAHKAAKKPENQLWAQQRASLCGTCVNRFGKRAA